MTGKPAVDAVALAQDLIRCRSVTPHDGGAIAVLQRALGDLGFTCHRLKFGPPGAEIENLYARLGTAQPHLCFAGHTDVVPPGDLAAWSVDPFAAQVKGDALIGRGAADMKGAIAAFAAAAARVIAKTGGRLPGSISLLITGDEEGPAVDGTAKVLAWLTQRGETIDACLVGEPTSADELGDTIKHGRRGSLTGRLTVPGRQGHVGYPQRADNPIPRLCRMVLAIADEALDSGNAHFEPSGLQVTSVDVGNPAANVIPGAAHAVFNIRFNDRHTAASLETWLRRRFDAVAGKNYSLSLELAAEPFLTAPGPFTDLLADAVADVRGRRPSLSTSGGTSDARFIRRHCPVAELGLVGRTMHGIDERVAVADLAQLAAIYERVLERFFKL
jgi:succinyl-diaminopimelate desuccinylase